MATKSICKVLVVGGTGYFGRRIVTASLAHGHKTFVLQRPELGLDADKVQLLLSFKKQGAVLVEGSFSDHRSLVDAVKQVDVVICTMSGVHFRSHNLLLQLKLVEAIKETGNVKRFLPSEFGMDPARMGHALEPGRVSFDEKMTVRKAIEAAKREMSVKSSVCNAGQVKANSTSKMLLEKLPTKLPLHARSTKGITKESAITDHLRKPALDSRRRCDGDGRKTLEPSVSQMRPKRAASKNQRSKVM